jgi:O-succinylbenzoic acid--CoA ligase
VGSPEPHIVDSSQADQVIEAVSQLLGENPTSVFIHDPARPGRLGGPMPDQPVLVIETSGSTGAPKQVWLSPRALRFAAETTSERLGGPGVWWLALPLHYIAGVQVVLRSLVTESPLVIGPPKGSIAQKLLSDASALASYASQGRAVRTSLVPTQLADLLDAVDSGELRVEQLSVIDTVLVGGQRVDSALVERAQKSGLMVIRTYGAAETSGGCVWDGVPLPGVSVDIVDGRVAMSGPMLAGGYLGDEGDHEVFIERGGSRWFISADLGHITNSVLSVTGRADEVIVSGGLKVSASDIERVLREGAGLPDALVLAMPHPRWGSVPVVFTTHACELENVRNITKAALGPAAQPHAVISLESWPLLSSGKIDRTALMERASKELA